MYAYLMFELYFVLFVFLLTIVCSYCCARWLANGGIPFISAVVTNSIAFCIALE